MPHSISAPAPTLVFVIGCQRSGTTLTGQILGAHPNAVLLDEDDDIYNWFKAISPTDPLNQGKLGPILGLAARKYQTPSSRFEVDIDGTTRLKPHVSHLVLKAPNLTYAWQKIASLSVNTGTIGLVRDPRAVVSSMAKLTHIPMVSNQINWIEQHPELTQELKADLALLRNANVADIIKRALVWKIKTSLIDRFWDAGLTGMIIHYERLIEQPQAVIRSMLAEVSLPDSASVYAHQNELTGKGPGNTSRGRKIDTQSQTLWKQDLSPEQSIQIFATVKDLARAHGYHSGA